MTALEARSQLVTLLAVRSEARGTGQAAELDEEIEACREIYTRAAVTEIAMLRAELWGPLRG
jgi:hypothetical protein